MGRMSMDRVILIGMEDNESIVDGIILRYGLRTNERTTPTHVIHMYHYKKRRTEYKEMSFLPERYGA